MNMNLLHVIGCGLFCATLGAVGCSQQKFSSENPPVTRQSTATSTNGGVTTGSKADADGKTKNPGNTEKPPAPDEDPEIDHQQEPNGNVESQGHGTKGSTNSKTGTADPKNPTSSKPQLNSTNTNSNVVTFVIPKGTGRGAWNTAANPIRVKVGQTLEVVNEDSVRHQFHTNGSPFGHPFTSIAPGGKASYQIRSRFNGELHDHLNYGKIFLTTE